MDPFEAFQFRNIRHRSATTNQDRKDRFWLVVSDDDMHRRSLFLGARVTHGRGILFPKPPNPPLSVYGLDGASRIDVQRLWTFPTTRDNTSRPIPRLDSDLLIGGLSACLKEHLTSAPCHRDCAYSSGAVVWLQLEGRANDTDSDLHSVQVRLKELYGASWDLSTGRLPGVVVASTFCTKGDYPNRLPIITIIPMLQLPLFRQRYPQNPIIRHPGNPTEEPYSVLTQLLLSMDVAEEKGCISLSDGQRHSWRATTTELAAVRGRVLLHLGIAYTEQKHEA